MANVEFAHKILEEGDRQRVPLGRRAVWIEALEVAVLATVAIATAWSGFEAAKWNGLSGRQYSLGLRTTVLEEEKATLAGQDRLYDTTTFDDWVRAKETGNDKLAAVYERRFRPEYAVAFKAWQGLDPFHNSASPPGPGFMPEYVDANAQASAKFHEEANRYFDKGVSLRDTGDEYIRVTVFLATVLLLTAIGQRIRSFWPRATIVTVAFILLISSAYHLLTLPRVW